MRCCTIKLKRAWEYCPGCGDSISWPPAAAEVARRKSEHEHRMATDHGYARRYEERQKWMELYMNSAVWNFFGTLPLVQMEINRIQSAEVEILAGRA